MQNAECKTQKGERRDVTLSGETAAWLPLW